jgi:arylsulfatase A-like enzyme
MSEMGAVTKGMGIIMNILVLICDELRYDALQCNGNHYVLTPNLDRLAARSVQFTNAFTSAPVCSPARHSLISGIYPFAHGVLKNGIKPVKPLVTIADKLNAKGYRSVQIGAITPMQEHSDYGFENKTLKDWASILSERKRKILEWEHLALTIRRTAGPSPRTAEEHKGYLVAERAVGLLEEAVAKGEKFHYWIGFPEPHPPFYPPKSYYAKFDQSQLALPHEVPRSAPDPHPSIADKQQEWSHLTDVEKRQMCAGYYGLVEMMDEFVGRVLDTVDRLNIADDTLIVFTSDHGEQLGDHNLYTKYVLREPSVHVPLMISHSMFAPAIRSELVAHVDLFPTLCDLAGADIPEDLHGVSLKTLLENGIVSEDLHKEVFSQIESHMMIRTEEWKLNVYDEKPGELYHLHNDPLEFYNLIHNPEYSKVVERLMKVLETRLELT